MPTRIIFSEGEPVTINGTGEESWLDEQERLIIELELVKGKGPARMNVMVLDSPNKVEFFPLHAALPYAAFTAEISNETINQPKLKAQFGFTDQVVSIIHSRTPIF